MALNAGTAWDVLTYEDKARILQEKSFAEWLSQLYYRLSQEQQTNESLDILTLAIAYSGVVTEGSLFHVALLILNSTNSPAKQALLTLFAEEGLISLSAKTAALSLL